MAANGSCGTLIILEFFPNLLIEICPVISLILPMAAPSSRVFLLILWVGFASFSYYTLQREAIQNWEVINPVSAAQQHGLEQLQLDLKLVCGPEKVAYLHCLKSTREIIRIFSLRSCLQYSTSNICKGFIEARSWGEAEHVLCLQAPH